MTNLGEQLLSPEPGFKRIDDNDSLIQYEQNKWTSGTNNSCYNKTYHQCMNSYDLSNVTFYIKSKKLRIIGLGYPTYSSSIKVTINDDKVEYFSASYPSAVYQALLYSTTFDSYYNKITLEMIDKVQLGYVIDAFDIDEDGYLMSEENYDLMKSYETNPPNVGDRLPYPQPGWQRIDDTDDNISYIGNWLTDNAEGYCNNTIHYTKTKDDYCIIYLFTKRFRLITPKYNNRPDDFTVEVYDDNKYIGKYSSYGNICLNCLLYEHEFKEYGIHKIILKNISPTGEYLDVDAIDIDKDGYILTEKEYLEAIKQEKSNKDFPVKISDDTITSEDDIAIYAAALTNGEKQLLIADKLQSIYVTNGTGGYTKVSSVVKFSNKNTLDKFNINDNNKLTWNDSILYTEEDINALNIKATNIIVDIKNGDNEETKTLQEVLNDILANGIQSQQTKAVCGTAICGTTTCGDL